MVLIKNRLNLIHNFLSNRKQRTKIGSSYSNQYDLFINNLFLFIERTNICNFANENTKYSCNINVQNILKDLQYDMHNILKCFKVESVKPNLKTFVYDPW